MSKKPIKLDEKDINFSLLPSNEDTQSARHGGPHPTTHRSPFSCSSDVPALLRELASGGEEGASSTHLGRKEAPPVGFDPRLSHYVAAKAKGSGGVGGGRRRVLFTSPPSMTVANPPLSSFPSSTTTTTSTGLSPLQEAEHHRTPRSLEEEAKGSAKVEHHSFSSSSSSSVEGGTHRPTTSVVLQGASVEEAHALIAASTSPMTVAERQQRFEEQAAQFFAYTTTITSSTSNTGSSRSSSSTSAKPPTGEETSVEEKAVPRGGLSLLESYWTNGIPDVEPWDRWVLTAPRYDRQALVMSSASLMWMREASGTPHTATMALATPSASSTAGMDMDGGGGPLKPRTATTLALTPPSRAMATKAGLDRLYFPYLAPSYYMTYYASHAAPGNGEGTSSSASTSLPPNLPKTKEERRAERKEKARLRQLEEKKKREAGIKVEDRLSNRNLLVNMLGNSVVNPLGAEIKILSQYEQRFLEHQRRNFERHMAALPHQIWKREKDAQRHAEERPVLRCYRIYPIPRPQHLGKLRNFANDQRLRGFIVWTAEIEAVVVLVGGEVAARHLDHWILNKMVWEYEHTRAERVCSIPLNHYQEFSFYAQQGASLLSGNSREAKRKRARGDGTGEEEVPDDEDPLVAAYEKEEEEKRKAEGREFVFLTFSSSIEETLRFFADKQPSSVSGPVGKLHPAPWGSLLGLWRAACLTAYAQMK